MFKFDIRHTCTLVLAITLALTCLPISIYASAAESTVIYKGKDLTITETKVDGNHEHLIALENGLFLTVKGQQPDFLCGVIDRNGKTIIPIEYTAISLFENGFFKVFKKDGTSGVFDTNGKVIVPVGRWLMEYINGYFQVEKDEAWEYGLVDTNGNIVVPILFTEAYPLNDGNFYIDMPMEWFADETRQVLRSDIQEIIDKNRGVFNDNPVITGGVGMAAVESKIWTPQGQMLNKYHGYTKFQSVALAENTETCRDDMIGVRDTNGYYGIIGTDGHVIFSTEYQYQYPPQLFGDAFAVSVYGSGNWGVVDANNHIIVPLKYDNIRSLRLHQYRSSLTPNLYTAVKFDNDKILYGVVDRNGREIIPIKYEAIELTEDGQYILASVNDFMSRESRKLELYDGNGKKLTQKTYSEIISFGSGLFAVGDFIEYKNGVFYNNWGVIDSLGNTVLKQQYTSVKYDKDSQQLLTERIGETKIPGITNYVYDFFNIDGTLKHGEYSLARFIGNGMSMAAKAYNALQIYDKSGKSVTESKYTFVSNYKDGFAIVSRTVANNSSYTYDIIDVSGKTVASSVCDEVEAIFGNAYVGSQYDFSFFKGNNYAVKKGDSWYALTLVSNSTPTDKITATPSKTTFFMNGKAVNVPQGV